MDNEKASVAAPSPFSVMTSFLVPKHSVGLGGNSIEKPANSVDHTKAFLKERQAVRPPVNHNWSLPGINIDVKPPQIFQHELLQNFSINMFCKVLRGYISCSDFNGLIACFMLVMIIW